jgi:hypothetical protein
MTFHQKKMRSALGNLRHTSSMRRRPFDRCSAVQNGPRRTTHMPPNLNSTGTNPLDNSNSYLSLPRQLLSLLDKRNRSLPQSMRIDQRHNYRKRRRRLMSSMLPTSSLRTQSCRRLHTSPKCTTRMIQHWCVRSWHQNGPQRTSSTKNCPNSVRNILPDTNYRTSLLHSKTDPRNKQCKTGWIPRKPCSTHRRMHSMSQAP